MLDFFEIKEYDIYVSNKKGAKDLSDFESSMLELVGNAIRNSSKAGDIIFDAFLGSGNTLIAADRLGRKCYGMEIDPRYCQVICDRYKAEKREKQT